VPEERGGRITWPTGNMSAVSVRALALLVLLLPSAAPEGGYKNAVARGAADLARTLGDVHRALSAQGAEIRRQGGLPEQHGVRETLALAAERISDSISRNPHAEAERNDLVLREAIQTLARAVGRLSRDIGERCVDPRRAGDPSHDACKEIIGGVALVPIQPASRTLVGDKVREE
jgi:hypothetical protein